MAKLNKKTKLELAKVELTERQDAFCHLVALEGYSPRIAYEKVYTTGDDPEMYGSILILAKTLIEHPAIQKRIYELRAPVIARSGCNLEEHLYELKKIRDTAYISRNYTAAIAAEVARGKVVGLYEPKVVDADMIIEPSKVELVIEDASIITPIKEI